MENQQVPSEDSDLAFLTRLLQLAVGCRSMLRYRKCVLCLVALRCHRSSINKAMRDSAKTLKHELFCAIVSFAMFLTTQRVTPHRRRWNSYGGALEMSARNGKGINV